MINDPKLLYWILLCAIDEVMHMVGIYWYWYCNYSQIGWFKYTRNRQCWRFGPFMHTWSGWYYHHIRLSKRVVGDTYKW